MDDGTQLARQVPDERAREVIAAWYSECDVLHAKGSCNERTVERRKVKMPRVGRIALAATGPICALLGKLRSDVQLCTQTSLHEISDGRTQRIYR